MAAQIVVDIETLERSPQQWELDELKAKWTSKQETFEEAQARIRREYVKKETRDRHISEWHEKQEASLAGELKEFKDKYKFTPFGAKLLCAGVGCINTVTGIGLIESFASDNPKEVCQFLGDYLDGYRGHEKKQIVGFNIKRFDWPIINFHFHTENVDMSWTPGKWDIIDLCDTLPGYSLKKLVRYFNLPVEFDGVDGSKVAELWEADKTNNTRKVRDYCEQDVKATGLLFHALSRCNRLG